jgi:hypothetical protein
MASKEIATGRRGDEESYTKPLRLPFFVAAERLFNWNGTLAPPDFTCGFVRVFGQPLTAYESTFSSKFALTLRAVYGTKYVILQAQDGYV